METKKQILVILPPDPLAKEFCNMLSHVFRILYADNEEKGYDLLKEQRSNIAAVLIDLELARASHFALTGSSVFAKPYAPIPAIAVSPKPACPEDMDCLEYGFSDLITPPGQWQLIVKRINNAIRAKDSVTFTEMEKILKQLPSNIFLKDAEGKYVFATHYWRHLKQEDSNWTIRGKADVDIRKDIRNAQTATESDRQVLAAGEGADYIIEENYDGIQEFLQVIKRPTYDESGQINGIIGLVNDMTKQCLLERELEKRSKTDSLTGLLNKGTTEEIIRKILSGQCDNNCMCALMIIDVDRFKSINDTYGHAKGDRILAAVGAIIRNFFKGKDVEGRIGGDEFMIFLRDIEKEENALLLAERIEKEASKLILSPKTGDCVSLSIGISLFPKHGKTFEDLFNAADKALYYVKDRERAGWKIYSDDIGGILDE